MRTVGEVIEQMKSEPSEFYKSAILRRYAEEIIEECAKRAAFSDYRKEPTVGQQSILDVKKKL